MADDTTGTPGTTTGTQPQAAGGAVDSQAGGAGVEETPEQLKSRIAELESQRKQDLARLSSGEEARRQLEELRAQAERAATPPTGYDPMAQNNYVQAWQELQENNPAAAQIIAASVQLTQQELDKTRSEHRWYRELDAVPVDDRPAVDKRARELRVSPEWAYARIRAERYEAERTKLAEESRKLQEERDRMKRGVVQTTGAPAPPAPTGNEITAEEYRQIARRAYEGDVEARKRIAEFDAGRLKIRPG